METQKTAVETSVQTKFHKLGWYWSSLAFMFICMGTVMILPAEEALITIIRYILGALMLLFLPGYCLLRALFPKRRKAQNATRGIDDTERLILSIGLSLAIVPFIGLLLDLTPWGINLSSVLAGNSALIAVSATIGAAREYKGA